MQEILTEYHAEEYSFTELDNAPVNIRTAVKERFPSQPKGIKLDYLIANLDTDPPSWVGEIKKLIGYELSLIFHRTTIGSLVTLVENGTIRHPESDKRLIHEMGRCFPPHMFENKNVFLVVQFT